MKHRTPISVLAIALGLACTSVFAAKPMDTSLPASVHGHAAVQGQSDRVVTTVRKVYFFDALDRNHNGMLSRSEIPRDMTQLRRNFTRADFDENGQLSQHEYYLYSQGLSPNYIGAYHAHIFVYDTGLHGSDRISMAR
jgi:hypothetical protein